MKKLTLLPGLLAFLALASCQKEAVTPTAPTAAVSANEVRIADGHLVFSSRESLAANANKLAALTDEQFADWTKSLSGGSFKSYVCIDSVDKLPASHARMMNQSGVMQVGDQIAIYKQGKQYVISTAAYAAMKQAGTSIESQPNVIVHEARMKSVFEEQDGTAAKGTSYDRQLQFYYGGQERKIVHEVVSYKDNYYLVIVVRNKLEYYHVRPWYAANSWEIDSYNCHKEMSAMSLTYTGVLSPFGSTNVGGTTNFGQAQSTWGNNSLENVLYVPADALYNCTLRGSIFTEFWGNDLDNRNLVWPVGQL